MVLEIVVGLLVTLVVLWALTCAVAAAIRPKGMSWKDTMRVAPDVVVLVGRLARDRALPRRIRMLVWVVLAWMVSPIDLIPDVIPVLGSADDVVIVYFLLRLIVRRSGREKLEEHWPGAPDGLELVMRLLRLGPGPAPEPGREPSPEPEPSGPNQ